MGASLAIAAGLGAAVCFGVGDFFVQRLTRAQGWLRTLLWTQMLGAPLVALAALAMDGVPSADAETWGRVAAFGLCNAVGSVGLYRAFESGQLSVVSPIASSFGAVTVIIAVALGRPPPAAMIPGLSALVVGVALASVVRSEGGRGVRPGAGVGWAMLSSVCFGASFYGLEGVGATLGPAWPIAGFRLVAVPVLYPLLRARRQPLAITGGHGARLLSVVVLDSAGLVIYTAGTRMGYVGLVAVLASLFAAVTIMLALVVLRERLTPWQWVGVVMILAGVGLVTSAG